jgi:hypothetical protein
MMQVGLVLILLVASTHGFTPFGARFVLQLRQRTTSFLAGEARDLTDFVKSGVATFVTREDFTAIATELANSETLLSEQNKVTYEKYLAEIEQTIRAESRSAADILGATSTEVRACVMRCDVMCVTQF